MQVEDTPMTVKEVAARLGISAYTVRTWLGQRRLGFIRLGRAIRVPPSEVKRVLHEGLVPPKR
jgi:excisionase family DNA binding protein